MGHLIKITFLLFFAFTLQAAEKESFFHFYGALGQIYSPASFRVGHKTWEGGMLNSKSFGFNKLLYKGPYYAGFGMVLTQNASLGLYGSLGYEYYFWKLFSFRFEANATSSYDNYGYGELLVGATFYW